MRLLSTTTYPSPMPALRALEPVRPLPGRQDGGAEPRPPARRPVPAADGDSRPAAVPPGRPSLYRGDGLEPRARSALRAYLGMAEDEARQRLSRMLGIDDYA
ncbi:MAG TPA: hypothetical protein ENI96_14990 [Sedimenticola thiotaurini]|uniref:Uncharacterized protein n=1 Tax=Sedimenticola thiotaurini TaxID=1543721 RepID=A0A831RQK3_9GAMM|nr:hypothetical protein [Sedimenticola thiotaurini]